jgi:inner membrane protein
MASAFTHAAVGLALGTAFYQADAPRHIWILGALCAVLPDADAIAFRFGIPYEHVLGHRGLSHSFAFAALLAAAITAAVPIHKAKNGRLRLWLFLFLATSSHGLLDMLTNGGLGVALFAPFDNARHFLPWRPIEVSPISVRRFFTERGLAVIANELRVVWIPAACFAATCVLLRRAGRHGEPA